MSYATALLLVAAASVQANGCYTGGLPFEAIGKDNICFTHAYNACHGYADGNGNHVRGAFEGVSFIMGSSISLTYCAYYYISSKIVAERHQRARGNS